MASLAAASFAMKNPQLVKQGLSFVEKNPSVISKFTGGGGGSMSMMGPSMVGGGGNMVPMMIAFFMAIYTIVILSILVYQANQIRKNKKKATQGYISASICSAISFSLFMVMFVFKKYVVNSTRSILAYLIPAVLTVAIYFTIIGIADMNSVNGRNGLYFLFYILGLAFSTVPSFL